ncbi:alpha/beta-hydrolase [Phanerochaete sordida]|uniref:Alpha/beta-hydrolase n=1 Tax=Phanerochaete sordida TaxID=48140 RepID=A0A9P3G3I5_9APHY|nr:alpha/beta-hydrolase [Phanerochaete sordida]
MRFIVLDFALVLLALVHASIAAEARIPPPGTLGTLHRRTYFYAGGELVPQGSSVVSRGQVYVEHLVPAKVTQPFPLLFVHGLGMTGTNFLNTPDGRVGWADHFMSKGWEVYIVDQPSRGRSPWLNTTDGAVVLDQAAAVEAQFTATQTLGFWPQARLHTQWPGNGTLGDAVFGAFFKSTVQSLVNHTQGELEMQAAAADLFAKTGPVVLLTHSQGGPMGWVLADARPASVRAIVSLEPMGPPFQDAIIGTGPDLAWGITDAPLAYAPPAASPGDLQRAVSFTDPALNWTCFAQGGVPRKLVNLVDIPVLMVTSQASYHAIYDGCTAAYMRQAGVGVEHVQLADVGIFGNAHMMFMEMNNIEIAEKVLEPWLAKTVGAHA